jgi:hypothetical protein
MSPFVRFFSQLDRRWIFLLIGLSVLIPILTGRGCEEIPTKPVRVAFDMIENLPEGSRVLLAYDFDPSSAPELEPMATAWLWHCARKKHKVYVLTLWLTGLSYLPDKITAALEDFPDYSRARYGQTWVYLGARAGFEAVIQSIAGDFKTMFNTDHDGTDVDSIPMMSEIQTLRDFDLIVNASAGYAGTKEWIQYGSTPLGIPIIAGNTGVQAVQMLPYYPRQLPGLLAAVKGAAEYETMLSQKYRDYRFKDGKTRAAHLRATERMGPQLVAHIVILALIVLGNVVLYLQKREQRAA